LTAAATAPGLPDIEAAYRRVTSAINRGLEDAAEFDAEPESYIHGLQPDRRRRPR